MILLWISTHTLKSSHTADLKLTNTFGMSRCAWPHLYEWTESYTYVWLTTCYNQVHAKVNFRDIANSLFSVNLGKPDHNPLEMIEQIRNFHESITTCKKPTLQSNLFLRGNWIKIWRNFGHAQPHPLEISRFVTSVDSNHIHKFNFIPKLVWEIL